MSAKSINPATGELMKEFPYIIEQELEIKIIKAHETYKTWKKTSFEERKELFYKLYDLMISQKEELAKLDTLEMGMLYKDALGDIEKSASNARFFADNTEKLVAPKTIEDGVKAKIIYEPMGIVFSIMPWNYPFNQALRSV
ncbi:MAG: aldehyde dehydrogenase family protein, partial [Candidatus Gracilibacteria bacterium]|nr:aldehyde dehydrogenase family protein [Candidatus Gracilibacteria bacterium]